MGEKHREKGKQGEPGLPIPAAYSAIPTGAGEPVLQQAMVFAIFFSSEAGRKTTIFFVFIFPSFWD
jgi:hypothetical protein